MTRYSTSSSPTSPDCSSPASPVSLHLLLAQAVPFVNANACSKWKDHHHSLASRYTAGGISADYFNPPNSQSTAPIFDFFKSYGSTTSEYLDHGRRNSASHTRNISSPKTLYSPSVIMAPSAGVESMIPTQSKQLRPLMPTPRPRANTIRRNGNVPPQRRRAVFAACTTCRRRKIRCDEARPCKACVRGMVRCESRKDNHGSNGMEPSQTEPLRQQNKGLIDLILKMLPVQTRQEARSKLQGGTDPLELLQATVEGFIMVPSTTANDLHVDNGSCVNNNDSAATRRLDAFDFRIILQVIQHIHDKKKRKG